MRSHFLFGLDKVIPNCLKSPSSCSRVWMAPPWPVANFSSHKRPIFSSKSCGIESVIPHRDNISPRSLKVDRSSSYEAKSVSQSLKTGSDPATIVRDSDSGVSSIGPPEFKASSKRLDFAVVRNASSCLILSIILSSPEFADAIFSNSVTDLDRYVRFSAGNFPPTTTD
jgi:hypothetical protein